MGTLTLGSDLFPTPFELLVASKKLLKGDRGEAVQIRSRVQRALSRDEQGPEITRGIEMNMTVDHIVFLGVLPRQERVVA